MFVHLTSLGKNREKMEPLKADQTRLSETFIDQPEGG